MDLWTQLGRESGTNGESSINIHTLSGVRWIAGEKLPWSTGSPVSCSVRTWRDGMGGRKGSSGGRGWMYNYGRFALSYGRNQHNIVKKKKTF